MMRQRGSIYIITILTSGLVAVLAACALSIGRRQAQQAGLFVDTSAVNSMNESAIAGAQQWMMTDLDWRTNYPLVKPPGLTPFTGFGTAQTVSRGTVTMSIADSTDGNLAAFGHDSLDMTIRTQVGQSSHVAKATLTPALKPFSVLSYVMYCGGNMRVRDPGSFTANGLPLRCAKDLRVDSVVHGDVETSTRSGTINGNVTTGLSSLPLPPSTYFDKLAAQATALPIGDKRKGLLGPGLNSFSSATNPYGLYVVDTAGANIKVDHIRILGTLLIRSGGGVVTFGSGVVVDRVRPDLPAIIVDGNCELAIGTGSLTESSAGMNLNPAGMPYNGVADTDIADSYPSAINGLVYVTGFLNITDDALIRGALIVAGDVDQANSNVEIKADTTFATAPPVGFADITGYPIKRGTWQRLPGP